MNQPLGEVTYSSKSKKSCPNVLLAHDEFIIARRFYVPGIYDAVKIAEIVTLITCVSFLRRTEIHWYFWNEETSTDATFIFL